MTAEKAKAPEGEPKSTEADDEAPWGRWVVLIIVALMFLTMVAFVIRDSGFRAGKTRAHADMLMNRACEVEYSLLNEFMDTEAKQLALECHSVKICLHVDGKVTRCNSVTCETGDRCP